MEDFIKRKMDLEAASTLLTKALTNLNEIICLIKPQFECGKEIADKYKGVIKDENERKRAIEIIINEFSKIGFLNVGYTTSPITGGDGNIEYLAYFKR